MDLFRVKMKTKSLEIATFMFVYFVLGTEAHHNVAYIRDTIEYSEAKPHIVTLDHMRLRRDVTPADPTPAAVPTPQVSSTNTSAVPAVNSTDDSNRTTNDTKTSVAVDTVTQVPILGANGTGQRWPNLTDTTTKVSDPIPADDNLTNPYESPELLKSERNLTKLTYDSHEFYNSTFFGDQEYFQQYWANISQAPSDVHAMLSNSHRRATTIKLRFLFPFYGNWIQNITVATGGFIYTGEHTHAWLAATQYIAPLMANFDTSISNDSFVKLSDDGEKFTAFWENVTLKEEPQKKFTFAVTLHKNGDIVFAYKDVPKHVQDIDDSAHPVKIGISDAYLTDKVIFYVRRKTIYEYHRVTFKNYELSNHTILKLTALPTCLQYSSCDTCINHNTSFDCAWCENIQKCSSGTDRNKQDWQLRNCEKSQVTNASSCPAPTTPPPPPPAAPAGGVYETDTKPAPHHDSVVNTLNDTSTNQTSVNVTHTPEPEPRLENATYSGVQQPAAARPAMGGVLAALVTVTLVCAAAAWALYAFKNPHTRSGQLLIRYRPSQWNWRRGEARYTAATIHM